MGRQPVDVPRNNPIESNKGVYRMRRARSITKIEFPRYSTAKVFQLFLILLNFFYSPQFFKENVYASTCTETHTGTHTCVCTQIHSNTQIHTLSYVYIYIYIEREREREREIDNKVIQVEGDIYWKVDTIAFQFSLTIIRTISFSCYTNFPFGFCILHFKHPSLT